MTNIHDWEHTNSVIYGENGEKLTLHAVLTEIISECLEDREIERAVSLEFDLVNDQRTFEIASFIETNFPSKYREKYKEVENRLLEGRNE